MLKRFPRFYKIFCLCCSRKKLMREQRVAQSSEKNKDLISRLESIRYGKITIEILDLGGYIDKLERNENLMEFNILDSLATDIKSALENISEWKKY